MNDSKSKDPLDISKEKKMDKITEFVKYIKNNNLKEGTLVVDDTVITVENGNVIINIAGNKINLGLELKNE